MIKTILNLPFNKKLLLIFSVIFLYSLNSQAQLFSSKNRKKRNKNIPTIIKADSMDFDISKNVAVFTGNVQVDDSEMRIFCHKMIINFVGKAKDSKKSKINTNQTVKDIICLKNVVIIRKLESKDKDGGEQKALAGKAVYDVKAGKITLTIDPELQRGQDSVTGEVIIFWTDSERVSIRRSGQIQIRSNPNEN